MKFKMSDGRIVELVNLTEHEVTIFCEDGSTISIPSSVSKEQVPRVETIKEKVDEFEFQGKKIPVYFVRYGDVINLPPEKEDTLYIVSQLVLQGASYRKDLISPDTSPNGVVRDEKGKILGIKNFLKNP